MAGFGGLKQELWESVALRGFPDWTGAAAAKLAIPDLDLARYAFFMGDAFRVQQTLKAMGLMESSITANVVGLHAGKGLFDELTESLAHTIDPFAGTLKAAGLWEASLSSRMASIHSAWTRPDDLGVSMLGFARIARLSDAVHDALPFSREVAKLVTDEIGNGADTAEDATPSERDAAAIEAGLQLDLIAFPEAAYGEVVFAAGFRFRIRPTPVPAALEAPDAGAAYSAHYSATLIDLERRLRQFVEDKLSAIEGPPWGQAPRVGKPSQALERAPAGGTGDRPSGVQPHPICGLHGSRRRHRPRQQLETGVRADLRQQGRSACFSAPVASGAQSNCARPPVRAVGCADARQ